MSPHYFLFDRYATVWRSDGLVEFYIENVTVIDELRVHDLARLGLPAEPAMKALWKEAQRIVAKADDGHIPELTRSPYLLWIDGQTGNVLARWEAHEAWQVVQQRLLEARHAA
jgi:hypothetical protein